MTADAALFYVLATGAVVTALAVITARDVVHAVLFMVGHFVLTAVLYLTLQAAFVAAVQVVVYAGAIMVLFLFVVMLLGGDRVSLDEPLAGQRPVGLLLLAVLAAALVPVAFGGVPAAPAGGLPAEDLPPVAGGFGSPAAVGEALFRAHVLAFEIVSVLLLVAVIGTVVIAHYRVSDDGSDAGAGGE